MSLKLACGRPQGRLRGQPAPGLVSEPAEDGRRQAAARRAGLEGEEEVLTATVTCSLFGPGSCLTVQAHLWSCPAPHRACGATIPRPHCQEAGSLPEQKCGCSTNGASPRPDEPWGWSGELLRLRSERDGDTLCPVMAARGRQVA